MESYSLSQSCRRRRYLHCARTAATPTLGRLPRRQRLLCRLKGRLRLRRPGTRTALPCAHARPADRAAVALVPSVRPLSQNPVK